MDLVQERGQLLARERCLDNLGEFLPWKGRGCRAVRSKRGFFESPGRRPRDHGGRRGGTAGG
jgi:hypothetical protein